ncbi:haloacid dehalogenase [Paenibacillus sp. FSL R7-0273]|uniref:HAD family hydrolase n=1 Tax=Paenibacillus sp. FSL R7-0273 TaxID=1536772 RepID=UPI0004F61486|nr:HAD-IA family hydrolase [Paenibacillus sp. FSL R7-0273]AIQ46025.1 haloacid dehalogenase [Paenibacillus sp. FSL R7-0273]OMF92848.1 haloacid dehalogenase [Paenibacillus sp. FSL R7-0273]
MPLLHVNNLTVPCQSILFDKDGTLLDLLATWGIWAELVLEGLDNQLALIGDRRLPDMSRVLGTRHSADGRLTGYDPAGPLAMATAEETTGILAWHLYGAGVPWNEAVSRVNSIAKGAMEELRARRAAIPLPGLLPFLQQCSALKLKLGVVTSDGSKTTGEQLEWMGITGYFGTVVTRDRVRLGKPAPEMAETACRELGVLPENTIIIGDSNADMQLGKGAGLRLSVGISPEGSSGHLLDADTVITGYHQLVVTNGLIC